MSDWGAWSDIQSFTIGGVAEDYSGQALIESIGSVETSGYLRYPAEGQATIISKAAILTSGQKDTQAAVVVNADSSLETVGYPEGPDFWSPPEPAEGRLTHVFKDLNPDTKYDVKVRAKNGPVHSEWSNVYRGKTLPAPSIDLEATSSINTAGHKKIESEAAIAEASLIQSEHFKDCTQESHIESSAQVQAQASKAFLYETTISAASAVSMYGNKSQEHGIVIAATADIAAERYKQASAQAAISADSYIEADYTSSIPQEGFGQASISAAGATASAGDKSARSAVSISSQGQIMTTGIAALLELGVPQNVQAMGISLSEIQLSWDEVLSTDGYEYRFREKVL